VIHAFIAELGRVPLWTWWILAGLAAALWFVLGQLDDLWHPRPLVRDSVRLALFAAACVCGALLLVLFLIVERLEARAYESIVDEPTTDGADAPGVH